MSGVRIRNTSTVTLLYGRIRNMTHRFTNWHRQMVLLLQSSPFMPSIKAPRPVDAYICMWAESSQVLALLAPTNYLNQCWFFIKIHSVGPLRATLIHLITCAKFITFCVFDTDPVQTITVVRDTIVNNIVLCYELACRLSLANLLNLIPYESCSVTTVFDPVSFPILLMAE